MSLPMNEEQRPLILVVDDNEAGRYATAKTLQMGGFDILEATKGSEALELAQKQPDLIVLDVNLPDMSGFDVCQALKANIATRAIPILHLSATRIDVPSRVQGLDAGADGYLSQPVASDELISVINALLRIKKAEVRALIAIQERDVTIKKLEAALDEIKTLSGLLPICSKCKKIRNVEGYWEQIEKYLSTHTNVTFTHGVCHDCYQELYPESNE